MRAIPRLAIEGKYAYDYLLYQITGKTELREIVHYWGKDTKQCLLVWNYCRAIYCINKILFTDKTFAEVKKHSQGGHFYVILLKIECGKPES